MLLSSFYRILLAAFIVWVAAGFITSDCTAQESKLMALLENSPSAANALSYVHPPSLRKLMKEAENIEGDDKLLAEVEEAWLISKLDLISSLPQWEAGYATLNTLIDKSKLAAAVGGYVDNIDGEDVVWSPNQAYIRPMSESSIGFLRPANRALVAEWMKTDARANISPYLAAIAKRPPEQYLSFMLSVDLEDAFSPVALEQRIEGFEVLKGMDPQATAKLLASIKGVTIIVGRESLNQCIVSVDFGIAPNSLLPVANEFLDEILKRNGTQVAEILSWQARVEGNSIKFRGAVGENTLYALLGVFSLDSQADQLASSLKRQGAEDSKKPGEPTAYDTKKYFDDVGKILERVRKYDAQSTGYRAKWNDQNARRIDELGTLGVDPQMIEYGANVSSTLRQNAMSINQLNVQSGQTQAAQGLSSGGYYSRGGYGGYYSGAYGSTWGYYDPNRTTDYQRVTGAQTRMAGFGSFKTIMAEIDQMTADIRRVMTEKWNLQF